MAEAEACVPHLIDGVAVPAGPAALGGGGETPVVLAMRAARPLLDRLEPAGRSRVGAVVVSHPDPDPRRVREMAEHLGVGLRIAEAVPLPVGGLGEAGVLSALHVARAALSGEAETVLLVSFAAGVVAALRLGREGVVACRPLPPTRAGRPAAMDDGLEARPRGAALARMVEHGGLRRRAIRRAASPGRPRVEAAAVLREAGLSHVLAQARDGELAAASSVEQALVMALAATSLPPTLLWACGAGGDLGACVLERSERR